MANRPRRPGPSPAGMLVKGFSWLDEHPKFAGSPADAEALAFIHATARTLAAKRAELSASQTQVARWAQVTRQTVAAIEDGTTWPDYLSVLKVAAALGMSLNPTPGLPVGPRPGHGFAALKPKGWN